MINEKQKNTITVNTMSNSNQKDNTAYRLYLRSKLQKSQEDIKNGRVMTIEDSKERMRKKYANFNVK